MNTVSIHRRISFNAGMRRATKCTNSRTVRQAIGAITRALAMGGSVSQPNARVTATTTDAWKSDKIYLNMKPETKQP